MADLGAISEALPSTATVIQFGTTTLHAITIFILIVVTATILGIGAFFFIRWLRFSKRIWVFELVGNNWELTKKDRATELIINRMGDTVFYLRKYKKYLPRPSGQVGRRLYWFYIGEDGEWRNFKLGDMDEQARVIGIKFLNPAIRYSRAALKNLWKERFDKPKFMEKYGQYILPIIFFAVIGLFLWLNVDRLLTIGNQLTAMVKTSGDVMDKADRVLASLANICTGSGARGAG
jgi:hypothetical protein